MFKSVAVASILVASISAAPVESAFNKRQVGYTQYNGDGSAAQGWPTIDQWQSFDSLWNTNYPLITQSCGWNGWGANDSPQEASDLQNAIQQVAGNNGVDPRFVLAIVMQESKGCVRVPTTGNGVSNPGLMQDHDGSGTCAGVDPCPTSEIFQMIQDGTAGTSAGDGLVQTIAFAVNNGGESGAQSIYAAARKYNSGSVDFQDLSQAFGSTVSYASDVANRLVGWAN